MTATTHIIPCDQVCACAVTPGVLTWGPARLVIENAKRKKCLAETILERPKFCYLLIFPEPEVRTHLPIIRVCHGAQIHSWCQLDIFFLLVFSMTRRTRRTMGHYGGITLVPVTRRANKCHQCHHGSANKDNASFSWVK